MALTPRSVFRYFKVDGVPSSGKHDPIKAEIIQLLESIFGVSRGGWVVAQTLSALIGVTPEDENDGGVVLNDLNPASNGYYSRSAGAWVFGRGFPDTFAKVTLSGSGTAQTGTVNTGVNPASIEVFFAKVVTPNTGPMTLSVSDGPSRAVINLAGNPLSAGEWTGVVMFYLNDANQYQLLIDAGAAAAAAQSATNAAQSAADADLEAVRAEAAADVATGAMSAVVLAENTFSTKAIAEIWHPVAAPDFIRTAGYASAGDGGGALYAKVGSEPAHAGKLSITLSDGATVVWYGLVGDVVPFEAIGVVTGSVSLAVAEENANRINSMIEGLSAGGGGALSVPTKLTLTGHMLQLKSNVSLVGTGPSSKIHAHDDWADTYVYKGDTLPRYILVGCGRLDTTLGSPYENIQIEGIEFKGPLAGPEPTHAAATSALYLEYINNSSVRRCSVIQSNDAAIHFSGYRPGADDYSLYNFTTLSAAITNGGIGYTSPPTVVFSGGGWSGNAPTMPIATAVLTAGVVTSIVFSRGGNIVVTPGATALTMSFSGGGGSGAAATPLVGENPWVGGADNNVVEWNDVGPNVFLGIELVGNAQCHILHNTVNAIYHGIRLAGGGRDSNVDFNRVEYSGHTALWQDYCNGMSAKFNYLHSNRITNPMAISMGVGADNKFIGNDCYGYITDATKDGTPVRPVVKDNTIHNGSGRLQFRKALGLMSKNNTVYLEYMDIGGTSTGISQDDMAFAKLSPAAGVTFVNLRKSSDWTAL